MGRGLLAFKQSDVRRALRATRDAGYEVASLRIARDGAIEIDVGKPAADKPKPNGEVNDLDGWMASRADQA